MTTDTIIIMITINIDGDDDDDDDNQKKYIKISFLTLIAHLYLDNLLKYTQRHIITILN